MELSHSKSQIIRANHRYPYTMLEKHTIEQEPLPKIHIKHTSPSHTKSLVNIKETLKKVKRHEMLARAKLMRYMENNGIPLNVETDNTTNCYSQKNTMYGKESLKSTFAIQNKSTMNTMKKVHLPAYRMSVGEYKTQPNSSRKKFTYASIRFSNIAFKDLFNQ